MRRAGLIWGALFCALFVPSVLAGFSPLLAWRSPVYIIAGFAGIVALAALVLQPILALGAVPGLSAGQSRRLHRGLGLTLALAVAVHVGGLWITSPPDVVDVLAFRSPTPFGLWGALAMWMVFAAAGLAILRRRLPLRPIAWRGAHMGVALAAIVTTVLHAVLIEGAMEPWSKWVLIATTRAIYTLWPRPR